MNLNPTERVLFFFFKNDKMSAQKFGINCGLFFFFLVSAHVRTHVHKHTRARTEAAAAELNAIGK